jgi:hypothetical protein
MNNADMSAMPVLHTIDGNWVNDPKAEYMGLTKMEYTRIQAMKGLMANTDVDLIGMIEGSKGSFEDMKKIIDFASRAALDMDMHDEY